MWFDKPACNLKQIVVFSALTNANIGLATKIYDWNMSSGNVQQNFGFEHILTSHFSITGAPTLIPHFSNTIECMLIPHFLILLSTKIVTII